MKLQIKKALILDKAMQNQSLLKTSLHLLWVKMKFNY